MCRWELICRKVKFEENNKHVGGNKHVGKKNFGNLNKHVAGNNHVGRKISKFLINILAGKPLKTIP